jgi:ribonuclease D
MFKKVIAFDTEFSRDKTYIPMLSLIQMVDLNNNYVLYDVLSQGSNLQMIIDILKDDSVLKIVHSGKQDLHAIYCHCGFVVRNVFDTQIAAKYCGIGSEIGYFNLANSLLGLELVKDKNLQYSEWLKRPLSTKQLEYARLDVLYLKQIYESLINRIDCLPSFVVEDMYSEMKCMEDKKNYTFNPNSFWSKIKTQFKDYDNKQIEFAKSVFIMREKIAYSLNIPRGNVVNNDVLVKFILNKDIKTLDNKVDKRVNKNEFLKFLSYVNL